MGARWAVLEVVRRALARAPRAGHGRFSDARAGVLERPVQRLEPRLLRGITEQGRRRIRSAAPAVRHPGDVVHPWRGLSALPDSGPPDALAAVAYATLPGSVAERPGLLPHGGGRSANGQPRPAPRRRPALV